MRTRSQWLRIGRILIERGLFALVLVAAVSGCSSDRRERLVVYSPHGKEMLSLYEEGFEARHPDVDVQWIDMGGQTAYDRIRTESQNPQASLWWGGDSPTFARAAEEGLLAAYAPSWAGAVPPYTRDAEDRWYGTFLTPQVLAYNTRTVDSLEAPRDWDDLLDPKWKGRILIRMPMESSGMRTIFGAMILRQPTVEEGYRWLARLDENVKTYAADPTQLYIRLAREEGDATLWNMPDIELQTQTNGYPFGYRVPQSGTPVLVDGIALVAGAPAPDLAKAFYEYVTSDSALVEQAERFYRIPVREDIDEARMPAWIGRTRIEPMDIDWERLAADGPTWMQFWDENIKGRGAAYLEEHNAR